jgi:hypothetical protein
LSHSALGAALAFAVVVPTSVGDLPVDSAGGAAGPQDLAASPVTDGAAGPQGAGPQGAGPKAGGRHLAGRNHGPSVFDVDGSTLAQATCPDGDMAPGSELAADAAGHDAGPLAGMGLDAPSSLLWSISASGVPAGEGPGGGILAGGTGGTAGAGLSAGGLPAGGHPGGGGPAGGTLVKPDPPLTDGGVPIGGTFPGGTDDGDPGYGVLPKPPPTSDRGTMSAIPEPEAWALMILGVAAVGAALRRIRTASLTAADPPG